MKENSGTLILTSDGLTTQNMLDKVYEVRTNQLLENIAIVTTASKNKEDNPYSIRALKQYEKLGFKNIQFADLETQPDYDFSSFDVIHVCGGNTFKLLHFARKTNFDEVINLLLDRKGLYVGVSAGTIIVTPSIKFVSDLRLDPNEIEMKDFSAFNFTSKNIFVHYDESLEGLVKNYENQNKTYFMRISNSQAVLIENSITRII